MKQLLKEEYKDTDQWLSELSGLIDRLQNLPDFRSSVVWQEARNKYDDDGDVEIAVAISYLAALASKKRFRCLEASIFGSLITKEQAQEYLVEIENLIIRVHSLVEAITTLLQIFLFFNVKFKRPVKALLQLLQLATGKGEQNIPLTIKTVYGDLVKTI